jgi:hypothetical protein
MAGTEMVPEALVVFDEQIRPISREDFIHKYNDSLL